MRDPITADLLAYHGARLADAGHPDNMDDLAHALGYRVIHGRTSLLSNPKEITLARGLPRRARRVVLAHELSHGVMRERVPDDPDAPSYEDVIRHYHVSVPDMDSHLELMAVAGGDEFAMPPALVNAVLDQCDWTARAVLELANFAQVPLKDALRRVVLFDESRRIAGFISAGGFIQHAESHLMHLPVWKGDRVPEPHILLGEGVSVFRVPHRPGQLIVLITVGQFEAA